MVSRKRKVLLTRWPSACCMSSPWPTGPSIACRSIVTIPGNIYGPYDNFDLENAHVVPALVRKFVEATDQGLDRLVVWGSGEPTRDFVYAGDVAAGHPAGRVNATTAPSWSISPRDRRRAFAGGRTHCREISGFGGEVVWDATRPDGQSRRVFDISRARADLGWEPITSLSDGLARTLRWYREHRTTARNSGLTLNAGHGLMNKISGHGRIGFSGDRIWFRCCGVLMRSSRPTVRTLDVRDITAVHRVIGGHRPDLVCHLAALCGAAPSRENPPEFYAVNTLGTRSPARGLPPCRGRAIPVHLQPDRPWRIARSSGRNYRVRPPPSLRRKQGGRGIRRSRLQPALRHPFDHRSADPGRGRGVARSCTPWAISCSRRSAGRRSFSSAAGDHRRDFVHPQDVAAAMLAGRGPTGQRRQTQAMRSSTSARARRSACGSSPTWSFRLVGSGRAPAGPGTNQSFSLYTRIDRARASPRLRAQHRHSKT